MDRIRVLIADDEPPARAKLKRLLGSMERVDLVSVATDGLDAVDKIRQTRPDVAILDIQMPGKSGFEVLAALDAAETPQVIFATAFDQHAIDAFQVAAIDYLLKPFDGARLAQALDRVGERRASGSVTEVDLVELRNLLDRQAGFAQRLAVEVRGRRKIIPAERVRRLEADGNYVSVYVDDRTYLCRGTLASYERRLDPRQFVRVHRSAIVNVACVREVLPIAHGDQKLVLDDGSEVRLSRNHRSALETILGDA